MYLSCIFSCIVPKLVFFFFLQVKGVVLKSGTVLEADVVIGGIGNFIIGISFLLIS